MMWSRMNRMKHTQSPLRCFVQAGALVLVAAALCGCHLDMWNQARYTAYQENDFFADNMASRPLVAGVVPYKSAAAKLNAALQEGITDGQYKQDFPFPITKADLLRGQEQFNIFCAQCHGKTGLGNGMIVQRGMKQPPSYHEARLRGMPPGYFFDVATNGFGVMYSYASRISPEDRWRVAAYVKVLQYSYQAPVENHPDAAAMIAQSELGATDGHEQEADHDAAH